MMPWLSAVSGKTLAQVRGKALQARSGILDVRHAEGAGGFGLFKRLLVGVEPRRFHQLADVAHDQLHTILGQARDVLRIARVRELVQHGHMHVRMMVNHVMHEIRPDETTATGHDDVLRSKKFFSHMCNSTFSLSQKHAEHFISQISNSERRNTAFS